MASDDDKLFAEAWTWVWTKLFPRTLVLLLIGYGIYSMIREPHWLYYGLPTQ